MRPVGYCIQPLAFNIHNAERFDRTPPATSPADAGIYSADASQEEQPDKGGFEEEGH